MQIVQNGDGESCALGRVRSAAELVQEHQRIRLGILQDLDDICHMGRKCTQVHLDALLVSDIGEDIGKDRQPGAFKGRDMKPCLPHELEESYCL